MKLGRLFGWTPMDSIFLGAILSISSTTIIIKALEELGKTKERFAELIFGILIVEDILAIVMIALLSGFAMTGHWRRKTSGRTVLQLGVFLGDAAGRRAHAVPRLLDYVAQLQEQRDAARHRPGAVLRRLAAGGEARLQRRAGRVPHRRDHRRGAGDRQDRGADASGARHVQRGVLRLHRAADRSQAAGQLLGPILIITAAVVIGKVLTCSFGAFVAGNDRRTSLRVGMGLAQIGEFSFIIAALGPDAEGHERFPLSDRGRGLGAHHAADALPDPQFRLTWWQGSIGSRRRRSSRCSTPTPSGSVELSQRQERGFAAKLLRQWAWQIAINLLLVAGVFVAVVGFRGRLLDMLPEVPGGEQGEKALLWLSAMILSLPMLIAVMRKLGAMGMLISEVTVTRKSGGANTEGLRAVVRTVVLTAGWIGLLLLLLLLSSAILPSWKALVFAGLVVLLALIILRRPFIRLYSQAQAALRETLSAPPVHRVHEDAPTLPPLLQEAELKLFTIHETSTAAGKLIGELGLRKRTGASIVGIQRPSENVINPGPDEELRSGDRVLLLGGRGQLESAHAFLDEVVSKN